MRGSRVQGAGAGFSLLELVVALLLFQVGLLAVTGMVLRGQEILRRSQLVVRGTLEARVAGDSLLRAGALEEGEKVESWGTIRWEPVPGEAPSLRITVLAPQEIDTLVVMRLWPRPGQGSGFSASGEGRP